ncbi:MAG: toxin-antitoxin system YwqK family antitoxin, partial [Flavobacteriales bacterium]|nr:toxin-antitoxin system YwqK family antitoxin [Flavobacteriales bacterium]
MNWYRCLLVLMPILVGLAVRAQGGDEDGYERFHHPNGQVSSEGHLVNGKPEGYWRTYYEDGTLRSEGNRLRFQLDSTWRFYDPEGHLTTEIDYRSDQREGFTRTYSPDGVLLSEEPYSGDRKQGEARYFHPDGSLKRMVPFVEGKEEGTGFDHAPDGRVITVTEYRSGMVRKREEINRKDKQGLRQGPWKEFHGNGRVKWEGPFLDDKRQGVFKSYDNRGNLTEIVKYTADMVDADAPESMMLDIRNTYHPNGQVASTGSYSRAGRKEGLFREFDRQGEAVGAKIYRDGVLLSEGGVNELGMLDGPWVEYHPSGEKRA